eukprot:Skav209041  [mRNA]  locus=scaffold2483:117723:125353:+ [translate_table: standard]
MATRALFVSVAAPSAPLHWPEQSSAHLIQQRKQSGGGLFRTIGIGCGVLSFTAGLLGRKRFVRARGLGSQSRVQRAAESFSGESNAEDSQAALNEVLSAVKPKSGFALLLIPRRFLADASALVQRATQSLGAVQLVAFVTGGPTLQLCALESPTGQVQVFSADPNSLVDQLRNSAPAANGGCDFEGATAMASGQSTVGCPP